MAGFRERLRGSLIVRRLKRGHCSALLLVVGVLLLFVLAPGGCNRKSDYRQVPDSRFKVIDSGFWNADLTSLAEPLWLDSERLVFPSTENLVPGKGPYRIVVWNTATGTTTFSAVEGVRCVRDDQVVVAKETPPHSDQWVYYRGPLENLKEHPAPSPDYMMDEQYDCDWVPKKTYGMVGYDHGKLKLLGENYVDVVEKSTKLLEYQKRKLPRVGIQKQQTGDAGNPGKLIYHQNWADPGKPVPFFGFSYSDFLDAYLMSMNYYSTEDPETRSIWILQRNGALKEVPYPKSLYEGKLQVFPTKVGYLAYYQHDPVPGASPFINALYSLEGEQLERLIAGSIERVTISPNGCKAAFIHARNAKESFSTKKPYRTVKLINFCQGNNAP